MYPVYYPIEGDVLPILFDTFAGATGASITMTGLAVTDIEIFKDGGVTQRASDAGYVLLDTDGIDFDALTGIHGFSIDLNDNTDAGFYTVGPWYHVVVSAITVDGQTVNFVAAAFRIVSATRGLAGTALPNAAADAAGGLPVSAAGGFATVSTRSVTDLSLRRGTAQAGAASTITLDAGASAVDNHYRFSWIAIIGGTGVGQAGFITAYTGATKVATISPGWAVVPDATSVFSIFPAASVDMRRWAGTTPNSLVSGRVDASVGAMEANTVTAAALAADAGAEIADAVLEEPVLDHQVVETLGWYLPQLDVMLGVILTDTSDMQPKLGTPAGVSVSADIAAVKAETASILTDTAEIGAAGAGLTALATQASVNTVDTVVDAVKVKTDQLTFTVANQVDANAVAVNEDEILDDLLLDSVPADGSLPTVRQALYMLVQFMTERAVSGTTLTVKKADGSTALMTFTLDSASAPTSITRST